MLSIQRAPIRIHSHMLSKTPVPARYSAALLLVSVGALAPMCLEIAGLLEATKSVLRYWIERLRNEAGEGFPEHVTAFREGMAVRGQRRGADLA